MTTSNSTDFTITAAECIETAFKLINVLNEGDYLVPYDAGIGLKLLNMMIKGWQNFDNHLWAKQTATMFLQNSQRGYIASPSSVDHFTVDEIIETQLIVESLSGSVIIAVSDSSVFSVNDYVGVVQDNNYLHWSTVASTPTPTSIQLNNALTYDSSTGSYVFAYTNKLDMPFQVYAASRHEIAADTDVEMSLVSYEQDFNQPVKNTQGTPVQWSYDRQRTYFKINIWPIPSDMSNYVKLIISRRIQDIDNVSNNFDFPQEWEEAIVYNLAVRLAPVYGKAESNNFAELKTQASEYLGMALGIDNELGSIYLKPNPDIFRGYK